MNRIHPTAVIDPSVKIGHGNTVGPYAVILGNCTIGNDNWIGPHVSIGTPGEMRGGQHPATWAGDDDSATVTIGDRNIIREFTTVQSGRVVGTRIADDCYVMTKSHVPHDGILENNVTVSCSVMIGGHSIIQEGANLGLGAVIHQKLVVGRRAMIGMGSVVTRDVLPFAMCYGNPARTRGGNLVGMHRAGIAEDLAGRIAAALSENPTADLDELIPEDFKKYSEAVRSLDH